MSRQPDRVVRDCGDAHDQVQVTPRLGEYLGWHAGQRHRGGCLVIEGEEDDVPGGAKVDSDVGAEVVQPGDCPAGSQAGRRASPWACPNRRT
ncbi:MAG TPA: hypothetical protein VN969_32275 [Streptosporangiaceae bacterium]|nr:hypothetical protein [Streptosporangiaceae bacterium]